MTNKNTAIDSAIMTGRSSFEERRDSFLRELALIVVVLVAAVLRFGETDVDVDVDMGAAERASAQTSAITRKLFGKYMIRSVICLQRLRKGRLIAQYISSSCYDGYASCRKR